MTILEPILLCNRPKSIRLFLASRAQQTDPNISYFVAVDNGEEVVFTDLERSS